MTARSNKVEDEPDYEANTPNKAKEYVEE